MAFDAHKNFAVSQIVTPPSPKDSGTSLVVKAGDGALFPAVSFNAVAFPPGQTPFSPFAEIVRVSAISTDTFTIARAQESSTARPIDTGWYIVAGITAKTITDIENWFGKLASTSITTAVGSITTVETTVFTLAVTMPTPTLGRDVLLTAILPQITSTVSGDRVTLKFKESATVLGQFYLGLPQNGWVGDISCLVPAPTAGSHTYTLTATRDVGTGTIQVYADALGATAWMLARGM